VTLRLLNGRILAASRAVRRRSREADSPLPPAIPRRMRPRRPLPILPESASGSDADRNRSRGGRPDRRDFFPNPVTRTLVGGLTTGGPIRGGVRPVGVHAPRAATLHRRSVASHSAVCNSRRQDGAEPSGHLGPPEGAGDQSEVHTTHVPRERSATAGRGRTCHLASTDGSSVH
jgi:hypothetical protein